MPGQLIHGVAGIAALIAIAVVCSRDRRLIRWKVVLTGIVSTMLFAVLILRTIGRQKGF
jgi:nucleoside permease NupC